MVKYFKFIIAMGKYVKTVICRAYWTFPIASESKNQDVSIRLKTAEVLTCRNVV